MQKRKLTIGLLAAAMTLATAAYACDVVARKPAPPVAGEAHCNQQNAQVNANFQYGGDDLDEALKRQSQVKAKIESAARDVGVSIKLINENMNVSTEYQNGPVYNASGSVAYAVTPPEKAVAVFRKLNDAGVRGSMNTNMYNNCGAE